MANPDGAPMKHGWSCYVAIQNVDITAETIKALGGSVHMGPHEVPGGMHIVMGTDPQIAALALVGGKQGARRWQK